MSTVDITTIDKNLGGAEVTYEGITFYHVKDEPFQIYGLYKPYDNEDFKRMPHDIAAKMNNSLKALYKNTSGGRIRFRTDSTKILLRSILPNRAASLKTPKTGVYCFDLYADGRYQNVFMPGMMRGIQQQDDSITKPENTYDAVTKIGEKKMRDILIHFPLYNDVSDVYIGLDDDAVVEAPVEYKHTKPVVFYGSSITQGACASHAGNAYHNLLSMWHDTDIINLGFSSGCKAEDEMAEYIANLDMSVLIYDYDHNASTVDYLEQTHERAFKIIREIKPDLPIIMASCADRGFRANIPRRKEIIYTTYKNAVDAGDKNVYFLDGQTFYDSVGIDYCTVDDTHPNDLGFYLMAKAFSPVLAEILEKLEKGN